jgi:hypothetical protein
LPPSEDPSHAIANGWRRWIAVAQPADQQATGPSLAQLARVRAEILAAATRHGATNVRVFGSVARGDADAASDVDFLGVLPMEVVDVR